MRKAFLLLTAILVIAINSFATPPEVLLEKLDAYYEQVLTDWDMPGMAVGIVKDGELIFSKGYGAMEVGKHGTPDENTLYAIASNTKAFTATMLAILVQEGKIKWNDKVQQYLPWFEVYDPWVSREANIRDLMSHRIGLGTFSGDVVWYKSDLSTEEIVRSAAHLPQAFGFRNGYGYSNLMYMAAGLVIEEVTGKSWAENVRERILEPLGMSRTIVGTAELTSKGNFATPHSLVDGQNVPIKWEDWTQVAAMGGLNSSIKDMAQWMIFNLNLGIWGEDTLLPPSGFNMLWTAHSNFVVNRTQRQDFNRHFNSYGLGWGLSDYHGRLSVGHTGGYDGMLSEVRLIPEEKLGVVVLTNGIKSLMTAITNYTLEMMLGQEPRDWSAELLARAERRPVEDPRITTIKEARVLNTQPTLEAEAFTGTYQSAIYGNIFIKQENDRLRLEFERSPELSATLSHWHYDTWKIDWDNIHAWFDFGVLKFNADNKQRVISMDFEVPNGDIFFEELKPVKVK
ncbi:MAG: serine hydrolase [Bacteroides sp.]|jgi:CubicO group peptidase (beta-lactamase class C family)|nr:serine hydrolase [Bacteroides sp.]